jgi:hypothetical protein
MLSDVVNCRYEDSIVIMVKIVSVIKMIRYILICSWIDCLL